MRKITGTDTVIDELLAGNTMFIYSLIPFIRKFPSALLFTDDKSFLTAQSAEKYPLWVYVNQNADAAASRDLYAILSDAATNNSRLNVIAPEGLIRALLEQVAEEMGKTLSVVRIHNVYICKHVRDIPLRGRMIKATPAHREIVATLFRHATMDIERRMPSDEETFRFADSAIAAKNLFLLEDESIVSMARIVDTGASYARINAVVTLPDARNQGYAGTLMHELTEHVLAMGITPTLYAESHNPCSNACYQRVGFEMIGNLTQFELK